MIIRVRSARRLLLLALAGMTHEACAVSDAIFPANFEAAPDCSSIGRIGCPGFTIETPAQEIAPGEEVTFCYYFRTPNVAAIGIGRFASTFDPVIADVVVYTTFDSMDQPKDLQPPGTMASSGCGSFGPDRTDRIYSTHEPVESLRMPDDDGAGNPVALELLANAAGFIRMHYLNTTDAPIIAAPVRLSANGLATGVAYTKTATFTTFKGSFSVPPLSVSSVSDSCVVPDSVKFWWFSTHTHRHATLAKAGKGAQTIVTTTDWEHPAIAKLSTSPFYPFAMGETLTYACDYANDTAATITAGESYQTDENCSAIGYFFPAVKARFCYDHTVLP